MHHVGTLPETEVNRSNEIRFWKRVKTEITFFEGRKTLIMDALDVFGSAGYIHAVYKEWCMKNADYVSTYTANNNLGS